MAREGLDGREGGQRDAIMRMKHAKRRDDVVH